MRVVKTAEEGVKLAKERKAEKAKDTEENEDSSEGVEKAEVREVLAFLGEPEKAPENYRLMRIVTSPMRENSDIIYIYVRSGAGAPTDAPS